MPRAQVKDKAANLLAAVAVQPVRAAANNVRQLLMICALEHSRF